MASEEHRIRERLWARAQVWREQHSPEKASAGCPTRRDLYHSPNLPRTTARPTPPAAPTPKKTPSPGFRDKPSGSLVRRLGLGRIDDRVDVEPVAPAEARVPLRRLARGDLPAVREVDELGPVRAGERVAFAPNTTTKG